MRRSPVRWCLQWFIQAVRMWNLELPGGLSGLAGVGVGGGEHSVQLSFSLLQSFPQHFHPPLQQLLLQVQLLLQLQGGVLLPPQQVVPLPLQLQEPSGQHLEAAAALHPSPYLPGALQQQLVLHLLVPQLFLHLSASDVPHLWGGHSVTFSRREEHLLQHPPSSWPSPSWSAPGAPEFQAVSLLLLAQLHSDAASPAGLLRVL